MFEIGDKVWYRGSAGYAQPEAAIITGYGNGNESYFASLVVAREDEYGQTTVWGITAQFESRACHLCGAATDAPGCPLCPDCAEEQREREKDAKLEQEQRRRPR